MTPKTALLLGLLVGVAAAASPSPAAPAGPTPAGPTPAAPAPAGKAPSEGAATLLIFLCSAVGILFSVVQFYAVAQIGKSELGDDAGAPKSANIQAPMLVNDASRRDLKFIYETIRDGAKAFLWAEYKICFAFIVVFGLIVLFLVSHFWDSPDWQSGVLTAVSFVVGGLTSIISGYIGMMVAVYSNARTALEAQRGATDDAAEGWTASFNCAFRAGSVMGFSLCGLSLAILYILCLIYAGIYDDYATKPQIAQDLFECIAGYGLGGSSIAMFGRVGGGIFTKAADVGADLAGKVIGVGEGKKLDEDSPYNPACIADNVGDNVGDVAGMGSDLFGSFGEASCAALLVGASCVEIQEEWSYLMFPLYISAAGIIVCMAASFVATHLFTVKKEADVENVLKVQLVLTSVLVTAALVPLCNNFLPAEMTISGVNGKVHPMDCFWCVTAGLWGGCIIGFVTEYFTSHSYTPVRDVAKSTETGAATNIIYGLALGYKSAIVPVIVIAAIIFLAFKSAGMYGVSLGALGMLATLSTCLSIDVFGPVCDNAGGVAEMCELPDRVRDKTDALDAAGNTTAAIGKGFAIGSAALVSLALFGAFITRVFVSINDERKAAGKDKMPEQVNLLEPIVFAFLLYGAMVPYWFSALTMRSVGEAANAMVKEVARQWAEVAHLKDIAGLDFDARNDFQDERERQGLPRVRPEYAKCIKIATDASLREMVAPGLLVIVTPIATGIFFGWAAVAGLLAGSLVSSVQLAISMSNTGGAWDNAKKYTEKGELNGWFKHASNSTGEAAFLAAAQTNNGNGAFSNLTIEGAGQKSDEAAGVRGLKAYLAYYEKNDPATYRKIMEGEEPIRSNDGRMCLYSGKRSEAHSASVVGDTVGDPLKDTSGPALNIVMKLMAIISVVFSGCFLSINNGQGVLKYTPAL